MKLCNLLRTFSAISVFTSMLHAAEPALQAPVVQSMDPSLFASMLKEKETLQKEKDQLIKQVNQLHLVKKPNCCEKLCTKCNNGCHNMARRSDTLCTEWIAEPCRIASCQDKYATKEKILTNVAKVVCGYTFCLPYNIFRGLLCGTTFVCCGSECSAKCLNIEND